MVFGEIGDPPGSRRIAGAFEVIFDNPLVLAVGGDVDRTFRFDLDPFTVTNRPVIVSFLLISSEDLQLEVTLNSLSYTKDYGSGPERTVHEVVAGALHENNELTLQVHRGRCRISDFVVWYQIQA